MIVDYFWLPGNNYITAFLSPYLSLQEMFGVTVSRCPCK